MNLAKLAQIISAEPEKLETHPVYCGYITRTDGWSTESFQHDQCWSILYFLEKGEIYIDDKQFRGTLTPGDSLFIGCNTHPAVRFSNPIELREVWFHLKPKEDQNKIYADFDNICRFRTPSEATSLIDHLTAEMQAPAPDRHLKHTMTYRLSLLLALCDQEIRRENEAKRKLSPSQRVRMVRWVRENLSSRPSPRRVADMLGLSPDYFGRIFRNTFDQSPRDWLILQRIRVARRLLDEGKLPISNVMKQCGFDDQSHFSRQMKRLTGKTPGGSRGWKHKPHK